MPYKDGLSLSEEDFTSVFDTLKIVNNANASFDWIPCTLSKETIFKSPEDECRIQGYLLMQSIKQTTKEG
jgi:hypothetical protein